MELLPPRLDGPLLIQATAHGDSRGFFAETFRKSLLTEHGVDHDWVQDNHSRSSRGVLRGMHFQTDPGQAKLVRAARGSVYDVAVDLRRDSPTYGQWEGFELSDENMRMVYIPVGFAHGFLVTSAIADTVYKCSHYYIPETEAGIRYDDPDVGIEWPSTDLQLSERDANAPLLRDLADTLPW